MNCMYMVTFPVFHHSCANYSFTFYLSFTLKIIIKLQTLFGDCTFPSNSLEFPISELVATCSFDGMIRVWATDNGWCELIMAGHEGPVATISPMPTSKQFLFTGGMDTTAKIWDLYMGMLICLLQIQNNHFPVMLILCNEITMLAVTYASNIFIVEEINKLQ